MENNPDLAKTTGPKSVGIIMDGNRRWAKEQGIASLEGHKAGLEKLKEIVEWAEEAGVTELTVYAFSTENWKREEKEIGYLTGLMEYAFGKWMDEVIQKNMRVRVIGERERFSESIQEKINLAEERSKHGTKGTLILALSYGGRNEILSAVNKLIKRAKESPSDERAAITEDDLRNEMWSHGLQDPDLIIRTSGEKRLSNFLTWQSAYSELSFTDTKWPALTKEEFNSILADYSTRERRYGK